MRRRRHIATAAAVGSLSLLAAACGGGSSGGSGGSGGGGGGGGATPSNFGGKNITIWTSVDPPVANGLQAQLNTQLQGKGITAKVQRVTNINQLIVTKVQANAAPDIAMIPQPGVIEDLAKRGKVTALDKIVDVNALKQSMIPGTLEATTFNGKLDALLVSASVKGLVFYPKQVWDKAGYKAPTTLDELNTLTNKIKADKTAKAPWCMGTASQGSDGWPATDWIENLVMRYGGIDTYRQWVSHQVKFNSPVVKQAANEFATLMFTPGNVLGGRSAIASNDFGTAGNAMFQNPPGCMMYSQGSFITGFFPKNVQANLDKFVGVFGLPPAKAGGENPVEGAGDSAALFKDSPAAEEVMRQLSQTSIGSQVTKLTPSYSAFLSPHKDFPLSNYTTNMAKAAAQFAYKASAFGFDGSDSMPGAVGAGSFWRDMQAWISGQKSLDSALSDIDSSWP